VRARERREREKPGKARLDPGCAILDFNKKLKDLSKIFFDSVDRHSAVCHEGEIRVPTSLAPVGEISSMAAKRQHSGNLKNPVPTKGLIVE